MKIKPEHVAFMSAKIVALVAANGEAVKAHAVKIAADPQVKDPAKRMRWDLLNAAVPSAWVCANLYPYANDSHIDTALKAIVLTHMRARA